MEFKGTKGKWEVTVSNEYCGDYSIRTENGSATSFEDEANALLISKAPKMLDFINRISAEMLRNDFVLDEKWYVQAEQLIKEATEI
jgi:hypothetical protein